MTNLKAISNNELISRIEKLVRTERKITHLILVHILEIEERKIFAELGYDSMYAYMTRGLGYSEASAYRRVQSARLLKQAPSITEKIESGTLNLSQLTQVQKCIKESQKVGQLITSETTLEILNKLENKNTFETEKVLALEFDRPIQTHESIKPQQDNSVRLQVTLTQEQFQELEQAKSLLSHICHNGTWSEVIATLAQEFNRRKLKGRTVGPVSREKDVNANLKPSHAPIFPNSVAKKNTTQSFAATEVGPPSNTPTKNRKYISVHTKRLLLNKAQNCCEYQDPLTQQKCHSKYKLQIDHILPWAKGGSDDSKNLRILCQTHNNARNREKNYATL